MALITFTVLIEGISTFDAAEAGLKLSDYWDEHREERVFIRSHHIQSWN